MDSAPGVPTQDLRSPTDSAPGPGLAAATSSASAAPALRPPDVGAAAAAEERVSTTRPMSRNGLIGLLAAVSMVLVLGVSAGVIRAIVSERASRTKIA
jgi:hypothetical protein